jgi:hypothetical protein
VVGWLKNDDLKIICKETVEDSLPRGSEDNVENLSSGKSLGYPFYRRLGGCHILPPPEYSDKENIFVPLE